MLNGPQGATLDVCEKVRDCCRCWPLVKNKQKVAEWGSFYVPEVLLCHGNIGYGGYTDFRIGSNGHNKMWRTPKGISSEGDDEDTDEIWKPLVLPSDLYCCNIRQRREGLQPDVGSANIDGIFRHVHTYFRTTCRQKNPQPVCVN